MRRRSKIFICYRGDDVRLPARSLYKSLKARLGAGRLAMAKDALLKGDVGREPALEALDRAKAVLLLVGERWMEPAGPTGERGVRDPLDFVALELAEARRRDLPIIPVLIENADPPPAEDLPTEIADLFDDRVLRLRQPQYRRNMATIERVVERTLTAGEGPYRYSVGRLGRAAARASAACLMLAQAVVLFTGAAYFWRQMEEARLDRQKTATQAFVAPSAKKETQNARAEEAADLSVNAHPVEPSEAAAGAVLDHTALKLAVLSELGRLGALPAGRETGWSQAAEEALIAFQHQAGVAADGAPSAASLAYLQASEPFEKRLRMAAEGEGLRECDACPAMVRVPGGRFMMGSPANEPERSENEGPRRDVRLGPFALGRLEVTFAEWDSCALEGFCRPVPTGGPRDNDTDRGWGRDDRPVMEVSWSDVTGEGARRPGFLAWLNSKTPGAPYRLPSEAEWEYAARAGTETPFWWGPKISPDQANYNGGAVYKAGGRAGEYRRQTLPAGSFKPNAFGLFQVHGNVWEWVQDCWHDDYRGAPTDGAAWMDARGGDCSSAVLRGGAWYDAPGSLRAANRVRGRRAARDVNVGFRVARDLADE